MFRLVVALSVLCLASANSDPNEDRIVNGRTASINELPYQVSIQQYSQHFCGGTIISPTTVLSAAHCTISIVTKGQEDTCQVRVGSSNWKSGGVTRKIKYIVNHPGYDAKTNVNDVSILALVSPLVYSASIKPAKLCANLLDNNTPVDVSGWGRLQEGGKELPTNLQAVTIRMMNGATCASRQFGYGAAIKESMICAYAPNQDSCQGDSGGPLVEAETSNMVGIVSWGAGCAQAGMPGVYADVSYPGIRSFITQYCPSANYIYC
ncbi:trypsin alpha-3-like [Episyrphus balteatus]|uniref:trypsin alpha-3-like n=1 Tax=Episyrphus balteatus TaxID=286459 RepID=UPI002485E168|nr:trypsin alpha-3-like [Episyrphus balteatus]